jgi:hypothetical protein
LCNNKENDGIKATSLRRLKLSGVSTVALKEKQIIFFLLFSKPICHNVNEPLATTGKLLGFAIVSVKSAKNNHLQIASTYKWYCHQKEH